ncbi:MAG TPA: 3-isopropylmalate dehydratase, partial [Peptococcaceae bacterium]|nr:3-isopropylmalate dehydratase [Peptococcaceae bacterium]
MNLIEKYLAIAAGEEEVRPGMDIRCDISYVAAHDVTAPIAIRQFEEIGVDSVFDPEKV